MVRIHFVRHMKRLLRTLFLIVAAAAISGCASKIPKQVFHAGEEAPPDFLSGPAAMFMTNLDGFSASATMTLPQIGDEGRPIAGDLLERDGRFIFQTVNRVKNKKVLIQGGMFFIWDENKHSGFVLSDPLQAFAPMPSAVNGTNITWETGAGVQEEANGHACRRVPATIQCDDGSSARFLVWQAEDAKRLPVRIQCLSGPRKFTLNLTQVRLDLPAAELFTPPDGFTKYPTPVALMNELIVRQTELIKANEYPVPEHELTAPSINNWRQGQP
jgi:hypothetical protein